MNIQKAKSIRIVDLLETLGYTPTHTTNAGNQVWYASPLRKEKEPSFTVKLSDNCWKDFGGSGGNILDFIMEYKNTDLRGALAFLSGLNMRTAHTTIRNVRKNNNDNSIILHKVQPLQYEVLLAQLKEKGIREDIAKLYLLEAYYNNGGKRYYGYCMKNDKGGYEIHNKLFKAAVHKSPTTIQGQDPSRVVIFEGMTDYLSALQYHNILAFQTDVVILHSLAFVSGLVEKWKMEKQYKSVYTYLDNDEAGQKSLTSITTGLDGIMTVKPMNDFYTGHKDVNAFYLTNR